MARFADKVVIVTGSSAGIGQAVILAFAKEGASVVLHGTNQERIEKTKSLLLEEQVPEDRILVVAGPIEKEETQDKLINETIAKFGKINVLVNNAAASRKPGVGNSISLENLDYLYEINYRSMFLLTEKVIPHLKETKGNIVNTSSFVTEATVPTPELCAYTMIKSMINMLTTYQASRLRPSGVRVNAVLPGPFETNLLYSRFKFPLSDEDKVKHEQYRKALLSRVPIGKFGDFEGIAQVYLQLASNPLINGAHWTVDGGSYLATNQFNEDQGLHFWDEIQT